MSDDQTVQPTEEAIEGGVVNFGNVKSEFPQVKAGTYRVQLMKVGKKVSSKKGTPGVNFATKVADEGEFENAYIFDDCWISGNALWRVKANISAFLGEEFNEEVAATNYNELADELVTYCQQLIGEYATVTVAVETYTKDDGTPGEKTVVVEFDKDTTASQYFGGGAPSTPNPNRMI